MRLGKRERMARRAAFALRAEIAQKAKEAAPVKVKGVPYSKLSCRGSYQALTSHPRFNDPWNTKRPERPDVLTAYLKAK